MLFAGAENTDRGGYGFGYCYGDGWFVMVLGELWAL
jgi:hypothetical protein